MPEQMPFSELQFEVGAWGDRTFTQATPKSIKTHLRRELEEMTRALDMCNAAGIDHLCANVTEEFADVFMLMSHLAHREGFSLYEVITEKFERNKKRTWGKPDHEGVVEHIEEVTP